MNCTAKLTNHFTFNGKPYYKCSEEAVTEVSIITYVPHLKRKVTKKRCLCNMHAKRWLSRHRYQIKHCGKKSELFEKPILQNQNE